MTRREAAQRTRREREGQRSPAPSPTARDFGFQYGPWRRGMGFPRMRRIARLPLRKRFTTLHTRRDAVRTLARLVFEDPIALALWEAL